MKKVIKFVMFNFIFFMLLFLNLPVKTNAAIDSCESYTQDGKYLVFVPDKVVAHNDTKVPVEIEMCIPTNSSLYLTISSESMEWNEKVDEKPMSGNFTFLGTRKNVSGKFEIPSELSDYVNGAHYIHVSNDTEDATSVKKIQLDFSLNTDEVDTKYTQTFSTSFSLGVVPDPYN